MRTESMPVRARLRIEYCPATRIRGPERLPAAATVTCASYGFRHSTAETPN